MKNPGRVCIDDRVRGALLSVKHMGQIVIFLSRLTHIRDNYIRYPVILVWLV